VGYRVAWDAASRPIRNATYAVAQTNKCDAIRCERALGQPSTWTTWSTPGVPARVRPAALGPTRPTSALKVESRFLDRRLMGVVNVSSSSFACAQPVQT
jgi:hypothetical protein